jgi:hypothetical protein
MVCQTKKPARLLGWLVTVSETPRPPQGGLTTDLIIRLSLNVRAFYTWYFKPVKLFRTINTARLNS